MVDWAAAPAGGGLDGGDNTTMIIAVVAGVSILGLILYLVSG